MYQLPQQVVPQAKIEANHGNYIYQKYSVPRQEVTKMIRNHIETKFSGGHFHSCLCYVCAIKTGRRNLAFSLSHEAMVPAIVAMEEVGESDFTEEMVAGMQNLGGQVTIPAYHKAVGVYDGMVLLSDPRSDVMN